LRPYIWGSRIRANLSLDSDSNVTETLRIDDGGESEADQEVAALAPIHLSDATPMMAQYMDIKRRYPGCLLFYRMGDFYEMFFDDAVAASKALDITLTKRGKHQGADIAMCGVPVHSHESYLARLIRQGFKVAVCEQVEDPAEAKKRGSKSVVARDVIRTITAGTLTEDTLLEARRNNYLAALAEAQSAFGLAWLDVSTGEFTLQAISEANLDAALSRLDPRELLMADSLTVRDDLRDRLAPWRGRISPLPASRFDSANGAKRLESLYGVRTLDAYGQFSRAELAAGGALVDYVALTQQGQLPHIATPKRLNEGAVMEIDAATRRNLELAQTMSGERKGSLLATIDRTRTGPGARALAARLAAPSTNVALIEQRLDCVQFFVTNSALRHRVLELLARAPDLERALSRLTVGRGGPRDLAGIRDGLALTADLKTMLADAPCPTRLIQARVDLGDHAILVRKLSEALLAELPFYARDGGFIAPGFSPGLDELRSLRDESRKLVAGLEDTYAKATGVSNLKIRHNSFIGYYIEVPSKAGEDLLRDPDARFIHRQTMKSAVRFTTIELGELEGKLASAADKALALEMELFSELTAAVIAEADIIARAAAALALFDVEASLAEFAEDHNYTRPQIDESRAFKIVGGRHPVVEASLPSGARFVANGCDLGPEDRVWLLTGPNMAGKSTFLRQNALLAILAQAGSFVPAESAHIGIIDRLFSRVGAADDLARGRSTFMVEMVETAAILAQAGERGFVILDEIGRGTATFDGLSIAWAVVEHLHDINKCRGLFATHYHELTTLTARLTALSCHTMRVKEWKGDVVFLHEVAAGSADRSYGIHVGRLAGLPATVVKRAEQVLSALEKENQAGAITKLAEDLPLFAARLAAPKANEPPSAAMRLHVEFAKVRPDELTPKAALELLYRLKETADEK